MSKALYEEPWWPEFCSKLVDRPLLSLAGEYGAAPDALMEALLALDDDGPVTDQAWWPEAARAVNAGTSLRETARIFNVNLRRLRRGLARAGLRVAGQNIGDEGLPALAAFRERLGNEPDAVIAAAAGVSVEAVQGERRRLDIPPFRFGPPPVAAPVVEPARVEEPPRAPAAAPPRLAAPPPRGPEPRLADAPSPVRPPTRPGGFAPPVADSEDMGGRGGVKVWRRSEAPEPTVIRRPKPAGRTLSEEGAPGGRFTDGGAGGYHTAAEEALRLAEVDGARAARRGRMRLVRPEAPAPEPTPEPVEVIRKKARKAPQHSPVRVVPAELAAPIIQDAVFEDVPAVEPRPAPARVEPARAAAEEPEHRWSPPPVSVGGALPPPADAGASRPAPRAPEPVWDEITEEEEVAAPVVAEAPAPAVVAPEPAAAEAPAPVAAEPVAPAAEAPKAEAPAAPAARKPATPRKSPAAPRSRAARPEVAAAPEVVAPEVVAPAVVTPAVVTPEVVAPAAPLVEALPVRVEQPLLPAVVRPVAPRRGWLVWSPALESPVLVVAQDIVRAAAKATGALGEQRLAGASIVLLGPELV